MSLIQNVSLAREQSRPEVYFICGGVKMRIPSAEEFNSMGFNWAKVQIVPDGTLNAFLSRPFVALPAVKPSSVFFDFPDKQGVGIVWKGNTKSSRSIVQNASRQARNVMLAGWLRSNTDIDPKSKCATPCVNIGRPGYDLDGELEGVEDVLYNFLLDPDFLERMYGLNGLSNALNGLFLQGHEPYWGQRPIPFEDRSELDGSLRGVTFNSFMLPEAGPILHCELNAWHKNDTNYWYGPRPSTKNFLGRGPAPDHWAPYTYTSEFGSYSDNWFPFDPLDPDGAIAPLSPGDYVIIKGTLWQDTPHGGSIWETAGFVAYTGYLEIHPIDWMVRVGSPLPDQRKSVLHFGRCTAPSNQDSIYDTGPISIYPDVDKFYPAFEVSSDQEKKAQVLKVRQITELIDGRFSDMGTIWKHFALNQHDHAEVQVGMRHSGATRRQGRFKGTYIVTWEVPSAAMCSSDESLDRLDIFVRGTDDALHYNSFGGNPWRGAGWKSLGGKLTSDPAVVFSSKVSGPFIIGHRMDLFVRGQDNALWCKRLARDNGKESESDWGNLGGVLTSKPAACSTAPDRLDVFVRGTDNAIYYKWFGGHGWSQWVSLGGVFISDPAAIAMRDTAWVFGQGTDNAIYYKRVKAGVPSISSNWQRLDEIWNSGPAACSPVPEENQFDVFVRGTDNAIWRQRFDGQVWAGWESLGGLWASKPAATSMGGAAYVLARGTDNLLYFRWLRGDSDKRSDWQRLGSATP